MHKLAINNTGIPWARRRRILPIGAAFLGCLALASVGHGDERPRGSRKPFPAAVHNPVLIRIAEDIDLRRAFFLRSKLSSARQRGADLILIEIDSRMGNKRECLELAEQLRDIDWAFTVAYVPRSVTGGPALLALGTDALIGHSTARIGDVGELSSESQLFAIRIAPDNNQSQFIEAAKSLAEEKNRSAELVEAMIDQEARVYFRNDAAGVIEFQIRRQTSDERSPDPAGGWTLLPESTQGGPLVLSGGRAQELGFAQKLADTPEELNQQLSLSGPYTEYRYSSMDEAAYWLNTPLITAVLIIVGLVALYIEVSAPGIGLGGFIAGLCAILFFWGRYLGGTSGWLEVLLFLTGLAFLLMEVFVIPGWGISGLLGLILMVLSAVMAGQNFILPTTDREWNTLLTSLVVLLGSSLIVMIIAGYITRRLGAIPIFNRLVLAGPGSEQALLGIEKDGKKAEQPAHPLISVGDWGISESVLRPAGRARFGRNIVYVVSDGSFVEKGVQIRVLEIEGNRIVVTEVEQGTSSS